MKSRYSGEKVSHQYTFIINQIELRKQPRKKEDILLNSWIPDKIFTGIGLNYKYMLSNVMFIGIYFVLLYAVWKRAEAISFLRYLCILSKSISYSRL